MKASLDQTAAWLSRRAENFAAALLAVMFVAFLVQIAFRYLLNVPIGWSSELTVITWLWLVLWGAGFVLKESEEIRFELFLSGAGRRVRRIMGVITAIAILVLYLGSLPATIDYIQFMKVERTAYLKIPFNWLYSIYIAFAIAVIMRYVWILQRLLRGKADVAPDPPAVGSGL